MIGFSYALNHKRLPSFLSKTITLPVPVVIAIYMPFAAIPPPNTPDFSAPRTDLLHKGLPVFKSITL